MLQKALAAIFEPFLVRLIWLLVGFAGAFALFKGCNIGPGGPTNTADTTIKKETREVEITFENVWGELEPDTVTKPYPVYRDSSTFDTAAFLADLDTRALLQDYLKRRYYSREVSDSNVTVMLKAQVTRNRLDSLAIEHDLTYTRETTTKTITKPQRPTITPLISAGAGQYEPGALYHRGSWVFGAGYNFGPETQNSLRIKIGRSF